MHNLRLNSKIATEYIYEALQPLNIREYRVLNLNSPLEKIGELTSREFDANIEVYQMIIFIAKAVIEELALHDFEPGYLDNLKKSYMHDFLNEINDAISLTEFYSPSIQVYLTSEDYRPELLRFILRLIDEVFYPLAFRLKNQLSFVPHKNLLPLGWVENYLVLGIE